MAIDARSLSILSMAVLSKNPDMPEKALAALEEHSTKDEVG